MDSRTFLFKALIYNAGKLERGKRCPVVAAALAFESAAFRFCLLNEVAGGGAEGPVIKSGVMGIWSGINKSERPKRHAPNKVVKPPLPLPPPRDSPHARSLRH